MGEIEEERDNVGKLFENFIQASTCKGALQAFNVLCRQLDLDPADNGTFYSSLRAKVTTWKAKALWSKLDKRMSHKEYKKGQACVGTKVCLWMFCMDASVQVNIRCSKENNALCINRSTLELILVI